MAYVSAKIFLKILMPRSLHQNFLWCQDLSKDLDSSLLRRDSIKSYKERRLEFILASQAVLMIFEEDCRVEETHIQSSMRSYINTCQSYRDCTHLYKSKRSQISQNLNSKRAFTILGNSSCMISLHHYSYRLWCPLASSNILCFLNQCLWRAFACVLH